MSKCNVPHASLFFLLEKDSFLKREIIHHSKKPCFQSISSKYTFIYLQSLILSNFFLVFNFFLVNYRKYYFAPPDDGFFFGKVKMKNAHLVQEFFSTKYLWMKKGSLILIYKYFFKSKSMSISLYLYIYLYTYKLSW